MLAGIQVEFEVTGRHSEPRKNPDLYMNYVTLYTPDGRKSEESRFSNDGFAPFPGWIWGPADPGETVIFTTLFGEGDKHLSSILDGGNIRCLTGTYRIVIGHTESVGWTKVPGGGWIVNLPEDELEAVVDETFTVG